MKKNAAPAANAYTASKHKTFHSALGHFLQTEFPSTFGPRVTQLFADHVDALSERFHPPRSRFKVGQAFWLAVALDAPPCRNQSMKNTRLVPIILDLVTAQDIDDTAALSCRLQIRRRKVMRLFRQAHEQGAVLSYADVALLTHLEASTISRIVLAHEKETGEIVPRRGTLHDMGRSLTHKAIICYKKLVEKKSTSVVAQETHHSPEEVEYYVQCLRRIQMCRDKGMSPQETALATNHSLSLVLEYLVLIKELNLLPLPNSSPKEDTEQST